MVGDLRLASVFVGSSSTVRNVARSRVLVSLEGVGIWALRPVCHHLRSSRLLYYKWVPSVAICLVYKNFDPVRLGHLVMFCLVGSWPSIVTDRSLFLLTQLYSCGVISSMVHHFSMNSGCFRLQLLQIEILFIFETCHIWFALSSFAKTAWTLSFRSSLEWTQFLFEPCEITISSWSSLRLQVEVSNVRHLRLITSILILAWGLVRSLRVSSLWNNFTVFVLDCIQGLFLRVLPIHSFEELLLLQNHFWIAWTTNIAPNFLRALSTVHREHMVKVFSLGKVLVHLEIFDVVLRLTVPVVSAATWGLGLFHLLVWVCWTSGGCSCWTTDLWLKPSLGIQGRFALRKNLAVFLWGNTDDLCSLVHLIDLLWLTELTL